MESVDFCETSPEVLASALRELVSESKPASERRSDAAVATASEYQWSRSVGEIVRAATELASAT